MAWEPLTDIDAAGAPVQAPPEPSRWDRLKMGVRSAVIGDDRTEFPQAGEFMDQYANAPPRTDVPREQDVRPLDAVMGSAITPDPNAQFDILAKAIPGLEKKTDAYGNLMLKAPGMSDFAYLNAPGMSKRDLDEFGTQTLATAPFLGLAGKGASTVGRIVKGALGLSGASVAQDLAATAQGSEQGIDEERALISGGLGAAIPAAGAAARGVLGGASALAGKVRDTVQAVTDPKAVAENQVMAAFGKDIKQGLDPTRSASMSDRAIAAGRNQDLRVMDAGGENVGREARKAANFSPSAKNELMRVIGDRFEGQGQRAEGVITGEFGLARAADQARADLMTQARNARAPLYNQAFQQGASGIDTPVLDQLQRSPTFLKAMGRADRTLADQNAMPGWRPWAVRAQAASGQGNAGPYTLAFWDQVKRNLDDYAGQAIRQGKRNQAATITEMARRLRDELDQAVPLYSQARGVAQTFFKAENALEAGEKFATGKFNWDVAEQAVNQMKAAEKKLFAEGFADKLMQQIRSVPDRSSLLNRLAQSPMEQRRIQIALGKGRYDELSTFLRIEGIMDKMRGYMGNSTTAQQAADLMKGYGIQALGGGISAYGFNSGDPYTAIVGAILAGGRAAQLRINERVADEVAKLLTSKDPDLFLQGLQQLGKTPISDAIRAFDDLLASSGIAMPAAIQEGVNTQSHKPREGQ